MICDCCVQYVCRYFTTNLSDTVREWNIYYGQVNFQISICDVFFFCRQLIAVLDTLLLQT